MPGVIASPGFHAILALSEKSNIVMFTAKPAALSTALVERQGIDLLTVYAEAFERDANSNDFSLEAMIAPNASISF